MYYVYELINSAGEVEYVGQTVRPERKFNELTKIKPGKGHGHGKFYGRNDLTFKILSSHEIKSVAQEVEKNIQLLLGLPTTQERRNLKGEKHWAVKLSEDQVKEIKILLRRKVTFEDISKIYNVSKSTIGHIKSGKNWSQVL